MPYIVQHDIVYLVVVPYVYRLKSINIRYYYYKAIEFLLASSHGEMI